MDSTGIIEYQRNNGADSSNLTPIKPRLGRFVDVYSPEHLNITPRPKFTATRDESPNLLTPEKFAEVDYKCRTAKGQQQFRNVFSNCSFEGNQSFPRLNRRVRPFRMELETPTKLKQAIDLVRVDGPNGLRFNTSLATDVAGSPAPPQTDRLQQSINLSKAVFTIEPNTSKILIVNNKACSLLGYSTGELCGLRFSDLLRNRNCKAFSLHEPEDCDTSEDGTVVLLSGKVVELISKDGNSVQVSLWIRQLDNDGPCLVVAEPVNCKNVLLTVEADTGIVVSCEGTAAAALFAAESRDKLVGLPLASLIPSVALPAYDAPIPKALAKQKLTGRTLDGGCFPLCLWISKPDTTDATPWTSIKHRPVFEVNVRVTYNVSGLLVVDESGIITACNHHFAMLTFGKPHSEVIGHHIDDVIQHFCREADMVKMPDRNRNMTLSPVNNDENNGSASDTDDDSCGAFNGSQKSACTSLNVQPSLLSTTREKSSSALCLDKSCSMVTHTPTPTQDMVSSISTTEQRNDISALPDVTSGMSGISIDDENYCHSSISKSRSENILRSEHSNPMRPVGNKPSEKSDSIYYTSQHSQEVTPTGSTPRVRMNDPSLRLSFDSSKYRSMKVNLPGQGKDDKTSLSLDFCDSNETSADFLTPINEMPPPGCEIEDLPKHNGNESVESLSNDNDLETQTESAPRKLYTDEAPETPCVAKRAIRAHVMTSTPQHSRSKQDPCECAPDCHHADGTYRGLVLHKDGTELHVLYTVSSMNLSTGARVRCVWLGVQLDLAPRHTTLASSLASTADNSLVLVSNTHVLYTVSSMNLSTGARVRCVWLGVQLDLAPRHTTLASSLASTADNSLVLVSNTHVLYTVSSMNLSTGARVRCVWLGVQLDLAPRHTTLASSLASTADNSLVLVSNTHVLYTVSSMNLSTGARVRCVWLGVQLDLAPRHTTLASSLASTADNSLVLVSNTHVLYTVSSMNLSTGARVRCVWLGVQLDLAPRHTTLASSLASTADNSLVLVSNTHVLYTVSSMNLSTGARVRCVWLGVQLDLAPRHTTLASSLASTADNSLVLVSNTHVLYTVSSMNLSTGARVRCVWLGVQLDLAPRHTTLASSLASTADNSLVLVSNTHVLYTVSSMNLSTGARVRCVWLGVQLDLAPRHTTLASSLASTADNSLVLVSNTHVLYTVSSMNLSTGARVRCVWLGVQLDLAPRHTTLASSLASTADNSLVLGNKSAGSRPQSMSLMSQCGDEQVAGEYNKHYVTLKQIGKGAYGCVKMAYRRSDRLLTVAKFILKEKVGAQFWVDGPDGRKVPLELSLLLTLKHPNIVSVIDVFENEKYFQMVMEKHGAGMDLFEFIERRPRLDEPLLSYIFRQIGQAVEYLHSLNILHRDIKDENVIIDNKFHVKLIDFGSATFMSKDTLFSTFYGTTEYCSPEVLAGNKYAGPELEMWSMGITLYVLTFFVNPFSDIEDTIQGPLAFPQIVSEDLEQLLRWMLCKEPANRCTVLQMMSHPWIRQPVAITNYVFHEIVDCDRHEANPEMYFSGSLGSPRSGSPVSLADAMVKERSNPSEVAIRSDGKNMSRDEPKRSSLLHALSTADRDAHSDNYSLRSSADILDISSKPVSDAALTDISSDATGHAACDIDYDCDQYECDSWDECEQDSFS